MKSKTMNTIRKIQKIRFFAGMMLVGLLFCIVGGIVLTLPRSEMIEVDATILSIEEDEDSFDDVSYRVLVSYTDADGVFHENIEYPGYNSGMKVGKTVTVAYSADDPEALSSPGGELIPIVILAVGVVCVLVGLCFLIRTIRHGKADQLKSVDPTSADPSVIEEIRNNDEAEEEYYFHWTGKLNQSYVMETPSRTPVYEAICQKVRFFRPTEYRFQDHRTGSSRTHMISHTVTVRYSSGGFSVPDSSTFKIDGENNWAYLARNGYTLEPRREGIRLNFDLLRYGIPVAVLEAAGTNLLRDDESQRKLGDLPAPGVYRVRCKESDLEMVFMACFSASRVEFF